MRGGGGISLGTLSADTTSQLNVLRHDSDTLSVNGAEVSVFEETHEIGLSSLLQWKRLVRDRWEGLRVRERTPNSRPFTYLNSVPEELRQQRTGSEDQS